MIRVAHLSDLQIRLFKRHKEFRQHFDNLYKSLIEKKPDYIVLTGDLLHNKSTISAEQIDLFIDLLNNLVKIAPLHLIAGNHDYVASNLSRMDTISPITKALNNENIYYYKHSGVYSIDDKFNFVVFSCLDEEEKWPKIEEIDKNKVNIGLYHGFVQGAVLQNGMLIEDCPHKLKDFLNTVQYLFLGDIHRFQYLDLDKRAGYAGSLIQQSYGEDLNHGYLLWNIDSKDNHTVEFIKLPNVCPYYTLNLSSTLVVSEDLNYQKQARIRVFSRPLTIFEKKTISDKICSLYNPVELIFEDDSSINRQEIKIFSSDGKLEDLNNLTVQENLLRTFLVSYNLSEDQLRKIFKINEKYNIQAREKDDIFRNVQYKLGKMTFHNHFSYGENNEFDFSKKQGIIGIFGKSGVGKSSLAVDIPLYTIFNKVSKNGVVKNDLIINENKEDCASEIEILVGKEKHIISRATHIYAKSGVKEGNPIFQGKTDVSYKIIKEDGTEEDKTAEQRQNTDDVIRKRFGTLEDFVSTSMAPQWQLLGIVNSGATERLKLIGRYFDIDIFSQKHKLANDEWKEIKGKLKIYENRNLEKDKEEQEKELFNIDTIINKFIDEKLILDTKIKEMDERIINFNSSIIRTNFSTSFFDESELLDKISFQKNAILKLIDENKRIEELENKKNNFNIKHLEEQKSWWQKIKEFENRALALEEGCKCFHQDSCPLHLKIEKLRNESNDLLGYVTLSEREVLDKIKEYNQIIIPKKVDFEIQLAVGTLEDLEQELNIFITNREQIAKNANIAKEIEKVQFDQGSLQRQRDIIEKEIFTHSTNKGICIARINEILKFKKEYDIIKKDYDVYYYFLLAMSKDGIAKRIIADNLDIINKEIEKILFDVGFGVVLVSEEDGKSVEIYYERNGKRRNVSLLSGMERTIAALAIRTALIMVTTLPKSNVMVLDESFVFLDAEWKDIAVKILNKLKNIFDTVFMITHEEQLKDIVDRVIEIDRDEQGYSRICE